MLQNVVLLWIRHCTNLELTRKSDDFLCPEITLTGQFDGACDVLKIAEEDGTLLLLVPALPTLLLSMAAETGHPLRPRAY